MSKCSAQPEDEPSIEHVIRFIEVFTHRLKSTYSNKPVISSRTLQNMVSTLISALQYSHRDWQVTIHDRRLIRETFDRLCKQGLLTKGLWRQKQWLCSSKLTIMTTIWVTRGLYEGTDD